MQKTITLLFLCLASVSLWAQKNYIVQVAAYVDAVPLSYFQNYEGTEGIYHQMDQNLITRYFLGSWETQEEADVVREKMMRQGFNNALVIDLEEQRRLCSAPCNISNVKTTFVKEVKDNLYLRNIFFDFDKSFLRDKSINELDVLLRILQNNPSFTTELHGHTDSKGSDEYNQALAQRRVRAAQDYLIGKGLSPSRIKTRYFGEADPVAKNQMTNGQDAPDGRQLNRRVVIAILDSSGQIIPNKVEAINVPTHLKN